jgi:hypothetical protein
MLTAGTLFYSTEFSANPRVHGVLANRPSVVAGAAAFRTGAVAARCEIVGTDFFQSGRKGLTTYISKHFAVD